VANLVDLLQRNFPQRPRCALNCVGAGYDVAFLPETDTFYRLCITASFSRSTTGPMFTIANTTTAWLVILASGALEIVFSVSMKFSDSFTRLVPSVLSFASAILSVWLMSMTLKVIPVGTAYAVWAGIGAAGTAVAGMVLFQEPANFARTACIGLVVAGIVGLQLQASS